MEDMEQVLIDYCHNMPGTIHYMQIQEATVIPYEKYLEYREEFPRESGPCHCAFGDFWGSSWPINPLFHEWLDELHKTLKHGAYMMYGEFMQGCNHYWFVLIVPHGEEIVDEYGGRKLDWSRAQAKKHCYGVT